MFVHTIATCDALFTFLLLVHVLTFLPFFSCSGRRRIVEKKLKEMTKLAKWDEQTYYSLRETSERSHRQLFRLVVDWRGALEMKANAVFESLMTTGGLESMRYDVDSLKKLSEAASQYVSSR